MGAYAEGRKFIESGPWEEFQTMERDQAKGVSQPALEKELPDGAELVPLVPPDKLELGKTPLIDAINQRVSHRKFTNEPLSLEELSFLLWTTQGVKEVWRDGVATKRTVPSAGSRHPFETYLVIFNVADLPPGVYRYSALEHKLLFIKAMGDDVPDEWFLKSCAVTFIWTVIPYRTEWRYASFSHKVIALDAGHVCQNLYLACESIGAGTCAIGAYIQKDIDTYLEIDTREEQTIYLAPVGKV